MDFCLFSFGDIEVGACIGDEEALKEAEDMVLVKILDASPSCPTALALICSALLLFFKTFISAY